MLTFVSMTDMCSADVDICRPLIWWTSAGHIKAGPKMKTDPPYNNLCVQVASNHDLRLLSGFSKRWSACWNTDLQDYSSVSRPE